MRLLITGDRNWRKDNIIEGILQTLHDIYKDNFVIIQGGANGADLMAADIALSLSIPVVTYRAEWSKYGRAAGPIRNQQMLDEGKPDLVYAFHPNLKESRGTLDMVKRARKAGLNVIWVDAECNFLTDAALDEYLQGAT